MGVTVREAVADALAHYDYPDSRDEVEHHHRLAEADVVIAAARPYLILDGWLDCARLLVDDFQRPAWDVLCARLRGRDGWEAYLDDHAPWWRYRHGDRILSVSQVLYNQSRPTGYLVTFSWIADDERCSEVAKDIDWFMDRIAAYESACRGGG